MKKISQKRCYFKKGIIFYIFFCQLCGIFLASCGDHSASLSVKKDAERIQNSKIDTVDIPITKVKDQRRVGFCWSYAIAALIESNYLQKTGRQANISEEALGFYRMAEHLFYLSKTYTGSDLEWQVNNSVIDGYWAIYPENPYLDGFRLIAKYGLVPDAVWSFKFGGPSDPLGDQIIQNIRSRFLDWSKSRPQGSVTLDQIMTQVLTGPGRYPSKPPASFNWNGNRISANAWAKEELGFQPDKYQILVGYSQESYASLISALKRSLAVGEPVLLSFDIYESLRNEGDLKGNGVPVTDPRFAPGTSQRHMVLVTDFANRGGRASGMSASEIRNEVLKSPFELEFLVFKNSWGYYNWSASSRRAVEPGMYTVDQGYLQGNLANGIVEVIVPKEFAANPGAPFNVNPKVTGTADIEEADLAKTHLFASSADELNCRKGPSINTEITTVLFANDVVFGLGIEKDALNQNWMRVLIGSRSDDSQTKCYIRALKNYVTPRRFGTIYCPEGYALKMIGRDGGRYCESDPSHPTNPEPNQILGPFPQSMIEACQRFGGGAVCTSGQTWDRSFALSIRGNELCPIGTWYDYDVDFCTDEINVYGPFSPKLIQRCIDFTHGEATCKSGRWSKKVLFFLQRSEN